MNCLNSRNLICVSDQLFLRYRTGLSKVRGLSIVVAHCRADDGTDGVVVTNGFPQWFEIYAVDPLATTVPICLSIEGMRYTTW